MVHVSYICGHGQSGCLKKGNNYHESINMSKIEEAFRGLGRTEKVRFISQNIEYANAVAVASYVKGYLFDVLNDVGDDEYIAAYLREKGYEVKTRIILKSIYK